MKFCYLCARTTRYFDCMSCEVFNCDFCKGRAILEGEYERVPIKTCAECSKVIKALNEWNDKHKDPDSQKLKPKALVDFEQKMLDVQGKRLKLYDEGLKLEVKGVEDISHAKPISGRSVSFESLRSFLSERVYLPISHKLNWEKTE